MSFISVLTILLIALFGFILVAWLYRSKMAGLWAVGAFVVLSVVWGDKGPGINILSISLYPMDLIAVLLTCVSILRLIKKHSLWINLPFQIILVALILCAVSLLSGFQHFGLDRSGNQARSYIYLLSTIIYVAALPPDKELFRQIFNVWTWTAISLFFISLIRYTLVALGYSNPDWNASSGENFRVLYASQAFLIFQTALMFWYAQQYRWKAFLKKILPVFFLVLVIILQHRTVWVVALATIIVLLLRERKVRGKLLRALFIGSLVFVIVGTVFYGDTLARSLETSASNQNTIQWRITGWQSLLAPQQLNDIPSLLIGHPFGTGYGRLINNNLVEVQPHNYYVQVFWDGGLLGVIILLGLFLYPFLNLSKYGVKAGEQRLVFLLILGQLIYSITYAPSYEQGIILGLAIGMCRLSKSKVVFNQKSISQNEIPHLATYNS